MPSRQTTNRLFLILLLGCSLSLCPVRSLPVSASGALSTSDRGDEVHRRPQRLRIFHPGPRRQLSESRSLAGGDRPPQATSQRRVASTGYYGEPRSRLARSFPAPLGHPLRC